MMLSEHFTLEELTSSQTAARRGIDNTPSDDIVENLRIVAGGLELIRHILGDNPLIVSSGYRCSELNAAIGGAKSSAHVKGLAADFTCPRYGTPLDIARALDAHSALIHFDQLIAEGNWVHVAFPEDGGVGRGDVLTAHFGPGGTTYTRGLA